MSRPSIVRDSRDSYFRTTAAVELALSIAFCDGLVELLKLVAGLLPALCSCFAYHSCSRSGCRRPLVVVLSRLLVSVTVVPQADVLYQSLAAFTSLAIDAGCRSI
jgi:hypothetical protein